MEGIFLYSGGAVSELRAVSTWSGSVTNSEHTPLPVSLDIRIAPAVLLLGDYSHQNLMTARYEIAIAANGAVVFASAAELSGSLAGHTLTKSGTDFGETYYVDGDFPHFGYLFDRFEQTLALSDVAPGDTLTVDWSMKVEGIASGDATGALARIGWTFGRRDYLSSVAIIPEPGTACLLALGLVGLALRHRRGI